MELLEVLNKAQREHFGIPVPASIGANANHLRRTIAVVYSATAYSINVLLAPAISVQSFSAKDDRKGHKGRCRSSYATNVCKYVQRNHRAL